MERSYNGLALVTSAAPRQISSIAHEREERLFDVVSKEKKEKLLKAFLAVASVTGLRVELMGHKVSSDIYNELLLENAADFVNLSMGVLKSSVMLPKLVQEQEHRDLDKLIPKSDRPNDLADALIAYYRTLTNVRPKTVKQALALCV